MSDRLKAKYETLIGVVTNEWNALRDAVDALASRVPGSGESSAKETKKNGDGGAQNAPDVFIDPFVMRLVDLAGADASALDAASSGKRKRTDDQNASVGTADELEDSGDVKDEEREELIKALRDKADEIKVKLAAVLDCVEGKAKKGDAGDADASLKKKADELEASKLKLKRDFDALQHAYLRDLAKCKELRAELDEMEVQLSGTRRRLAISKANGGDDTIEGLPKMATAEDARAAGAEAQAKAAAAAQEAGPASRPGTPAQPQGGADAKEMTKLKGDIAELETKLKHSEKTLAELSKEKSALAGQVRSLSDAQQFESGIEKSAPFAALNARYQASKEENDGLQEELRAAKRKMDGIVQEAIRDRQAAERGEAAMKRLQSADERAAELDARLSHVVKVRDELELKVRTLTEKQDLNVANEEKLKMLEIVMKENKVLKDENARFKESYASFDKAKVDKAAAEERVKSLTESVEKLEKLAAKKSTAKVAELEAEIAKLKEQLAAAEASATAANAALEEKQAEVMMYVEEIEAISGAYAEAQEQSTRLLTRIATSEDGQNKAVTERIAAQANAKKFEDECARVSETAAYYKRDLDDTYARTSELEAQLAEATAAFTKMQEESSGSAENVERSKAQLRAMEKNVVDVREKLEASEQKVAELVKRSKSELAKLEAEKEVRNKAEAQAAGLKKKCERLIKEGGQKDLHEELQAYKTMMNCQVCMERQKSVVITRCFHMFCKECIDLRIETRARKCPGCALPFAEKDVSNIYF